MSYILKGRLCGLVCDDCEEPLARVTVRLYRAEADDRAGLTPPVPDQPCIDSGRPDVGVQNAQDVGPCHKTGPVLSPEFHQEVAHMEGDGLLADRFLQREAVHATFTMAEYHLA